MDLKTIKAQILSILQRKYGTASTGTLTTLNDDELESKGFLVKEHAEGVRKYCGKNSIKVSFRNSGENTITRIKQGNPCKGHDIMSKSIKQKMINGHMQWTYTGSETDLNKYKGLVGYSASGSQALGGVWAVKNLGSGSTMHTNEQIAVSSLNDNKVAMAYTGDYDMHDLIKNNNRILAATVDEASTLVGLNNAMLANDSSRKDRVSSNNMNRNFNSVFAPIRHGAQTSYISFLLSEKGETVHIDVPHKLPNEDNVTNIDSSIAMFDERGNAYLLDSIQEIYHYYASNGLLDQIPFYYFFKELRKDVQYAAQIEADTKYLNDLFRKHMG